MNAEIAIIGAGPIGLACGIALQERLPAATTVLFERGPLCATLQDFPTNMTFFSTAGLLGLGPYPFSSSQAKPTRAEALAYYAAVAQQAQLNIQQHSPVTHVSYAPTSSSHDPENCQAAPLPAHPPQWTVSYSQQGQQAELRSQAVIVATGFYQKPVRLRVPGEELPHVSHYYREAWQHAHQDVVIVGGANSAVIAALECCRAGARVHVVHRRSALAPGVKYWLAPDFQNRIAEGSISISWESNVTAIEPGCVHIQSPHGQRVLPAQSVLVLTGYRSDYAMLRRFGVQLDPENRPLVDHDSLEAAGKPGLFLAGGVLCGDHTGSRFIENGRLDAEQIADTLARRWKHKTSQTDRPHGREPA
jgi:thioredoxin reductase (NADPH)